MCENYAEFYEKRRKEFVNIIKFRTKNQEDAEDIVQDAFLKVLLYADKVKPDNFEAWFMRILFNCMFEFQRTKTGLSYEYDERDEEVAHPDPNFMYEFSREIKDKIKQEGVSERGIPTSSVLSLYFERGMKIREISAATGLKTTHCNKIVDRFKVKIKKEYK